MQYLEHQFIERWISWCLFFQSSGGYLQNVLKPPSVTLRQLAELSSSITSREVYWMVASRQIWVIGSPLLVFSTRLRRRDGLRGESSWARSACSVFLSPAKHGQWKNGCSTSSSIDLHVGQDAKSSSRNQSKVLKQPYHG